MPTNSLSSDALPQSEEDAQKANEIIIAVAMIIMGGLFTFAGGDYFATVLCGIAFCWGMGLGYVCFAQIEGMSWGGVLACSMLMGVGFCALAWCLKKLAYVIVGSILGLVIGQIIWIIVVAASPNTDDWIQILILVLCAILFGVCNFFLVDKLLKLITPIVGAFMFAGGIAYFVQGNAEATPDECDASCITFLTVWVVFTGIGLTYQFHCFCFKPDKKVSDSDENKKMVNKGDQQNIQMTS